MHQIKADACMSLGNQAALSQQFTDYDCAITEYQATIAAHRKQPDATVDMARLQTAELEALSQRRDRSRSDQEAVRFNRALMSDATVMVKAAPAQGTAYYYLGDGLLS